MFRITFIVGWFTFGCFLGIAAEKIAAPRLPDVELCELQMFPPRWYVREQMDWNRNCRTFVGEMEKVDRWNREYWGRMGVELDRLYEIWDRLDWAHCRYMPRDSQDVLYDLRLLRDMLGEEWYYRGKMPPAVPLSMYRR